MLSELAFKRQFRSPHRTEIEAEAEAEAEVEAEAEAEAVPKNLEKIQSSYYSQPVATNSVANILIDAGRMP